MLRSLNFPRLVILLGVVGAGVFGWLAWERAQELETLETKLREAPLVVTRVQSAAMELDDLQKVASREGLTGIDDPESYIRRIAQAPRVEIGQVDTSFSTYVPGRGVEDRRWRIVPTEKTTKFPRGAVANFLYKLESDSPRVRVTSVRIEPFDKVRPGQIGDDYWTFEAEITTRQATE